MDSDAANRESQRTATRHTLRRLETRMTREQKEMVQYAAALTGTSVSDFVARSVTARAKAVIRERQVLSLSAEDSQFFANVVLNPPPANRRLRGAARRHAELVGPVEERERFVVEQFDRGHMAAAETFSCGVPALDNYLTTRAEQDVRQRVAVPYVLRDTEQGALVGFYTLSTASVEPAGLLPDVARLLPRSNGIPIIVLVLGRIAVSVSAAYHGKGHGGTLLVDALRRTSALSRDIGAVGVITDATDEHARGWYETLGFLRFPSHSHRLFIAVGTIDGMQ